MDVLLVDEGDVFALAGIPPENLHKIFQDPEGLILNAVVGARNALAEKPLPLGISEGIAAQLLQLLAQVGNQLCFRVNEKIFIPLFAEQADQRPLQRGLTLEASERVLTGSYSVTTVFSVVWATMLK